MQIEKSIYNVDNEQNDRKYKWNEATQSIYSEVKSERCVSSSHGIAVYFDHNVDVGSMSYTSRCPLTHVYSYV